MILAAAALAAAGCGSGDDGAADARSATTATTAVAGPNAKITVAYDPPSDGVGAQAKQILQLGGTDGVAAGFTKSFKLPFDITIHVVNGLVGPSYNPATKTMTLSYGFVKEEDAADAVATVFLTRAVAGGTEYAFDAARFFNALSARQRNLAPADFFDEHSLDKQRAYSIVCWIAGSGEQAYDDVAKLRILSEERQQRCPAEYEQKVKAVENLLKPHARAS